jgi:5-methylcytosine-specific restriction endonuclease McrA
MFIVTKEWMNKYKSPGGGFYAVQLRQLGEGYPLKAGWMKRCFGKEITETQKMVFEQGAVSKNQARKLSAKLKQKAVIDAIPTVYKKDKIKKKKTKNSIVATSEFLQTYEWRKVRMQALKQYGPKCMCCGATPESGAIMNVDHIKPRKIFPELALDIDNLQILCGECNHGKGNWDMTDWRNTNKSLPTKGERYTVI